MGNLFSDSTMKNVIVNCAAVKKKNAELIKTYYYEMDSYISNKEAAYSTFSTAMNMITPTTYDNGETPTTVALEAAVYAAKGVYDNIKRPEKKSINVSCCTSDDMLFSVENASCIIPTMVGSYKSSDNVFSNKVSFNSSSSPDINSCALACSTNTNCYQALYNKNTQTCYLMGKDDPTESYTYTYSDEYSLLTAPQQVDTPPTNIQIPFFEPDASTPNDTTPENTSNSSSIIIISLIAVLTVFLFIMICLFFYKQSKKQPDINI